MTCAISKEDHLIVNITPVLCIGLMYFRFLIILYKVRIWLTLIPIVINNKCKNKSRCQKLTHTSQEDKGQRSKYSNSRHFSWM